MAVSPSSVVRTTGFPKAKECRNAGTRVEWDKAPSGNDTSEKGKNSFLHQLYIKLPILLLLFSCLHERIIYLLVPM